MPPQEIDVPELLALADDDPRWDLPAVTFLRDGSIVPHIPRRRRSPQLTETHMRSQ
jgi:hypothetical protein